MLPWQSYNDAQPGVPRLSRAFSFDPEQKSHSSVMYKSFVYPFIHCAEGDVWPACVCVSVTCGGQPHYVWMKTSHTADITPWWKQISPFLFTVTHSGALFRPQSDHSFCSQCGKRSRGMTHVFRERYLDELDVMAWPAEAEWDSFSLRLKAEAGVVPVNIHI